MHKFPSEFKENSTESTGFLFIKTYNLWHREIKSRLNELGITHPQFVVLTTTAYLAQKQTEVSQVMIADAADMDVMTVSTVLKRLEKNKLIIRTASTIDTRSKVVSLTEYGEKAVAITVPIVERIDHDFFSQLHTMEKAFKQCLVTLTEVKKND